MNEDTEIWRRIGIHGSVFAVLCVLASFFVCKKVK